MPRTREWEDWVNWETRAGVFNVLLKVKKYRYVPIVPTVFKAHRGVRIRVNNSMRFLLTGSQLDLNFCEGVFPSTCAECRDSNLRSLDMQRGTADYMSYESVHLKGNLMTSK